MAPASSAVKSWACTTSNSRVRASSWAARAHDPKAWLRCCGSSAHRASRCGDDSRRPDADGAPVGRNTLEAPALETVTPGGGTKSDGTSLPTTCTS